MKKLCAFILSVTTAISVFAFQPQIATTENQASAPISSVTQTVKAFVNDDDSIITYIGNKNTKRFHLPTCYSLPKEKNRVYISSYQRAINRGFAPCKNCNSQTGAKAN